MSAEGLQKIEHRGNLEIRYYDHSKIWYNLIACPLCTHKFEENEHRWKHFLNEHSPADAGLSPIGERTDTRSLFDATFNETGRILEEWGRVLWVIIDESGHEATIRDDDGELVVSLPDGVAGRDRVTLVDRMETAGFTISGYTSTHEFRVSRPSHGLQSPYRKTMGPTGEHALESAPKPLATDGGQPQGDASE